MKIETESTTLNVPSKDIREQLQRLLESPLFNHSRRYPGFLRYVVDEALRGNQDQLKERSIGIDVFGRAPDYDLNIDPVVRVTAGEVRKRLAQYYYEADHRHELRIELHPGSYIPEFKLEDPTPSTKVRADLIADGLGATASLATLPVQASAAQSSGGAPVVPDESVTTTIFHSGLRARWFSLAAVTCLTILGCWIYLSRSHSAIEYLWQPVWSSPAPVLIAVGSWDPTASEAPTGVSIASHAKSSYPIALADAITVSGLQQLLSRHGKSSLIQTSKQTSFADLQRGTSILVSGFDNSWALRLTDPLRFHFVVHNTSLMIEDRQNPGRSDWQLDEATPYSNLTHDYAIIARFHDPTTEQMIVVAAGIGENGTVAAGQVLANDGLLESISRGTGLAKVYRNMEAVIETQVIDGKSGPPRIVALTFW